MEFDQLAIQLLIGAAAIVFGIFTGRAKADRLRRLSSDVKAGRPHALVIVVGVVAFSLVMVLAGFR